MFLRSLFLRAFHTTRPALGRRHRRNSNPGVIHQLEGLQTGDVLQQDHEGFEDLESDFMDMHRTHRQYEAEMGAQHDRIRRQIVKQRHFQPKQMPNLLTYVEKEQIRYLNDRYAEEWGVERLAESFPATPETIKKVLRAKWRPRRAERIRAHDENVLCNWEKLRAGNGGFELLSPHQREHLLKFVERKLTDVPAKPPKSVLRPALPRPLRQDFLAIITSCSKYREKLPPETPLLRRGERGAPPAPLDHEKETYLLDKVEDRRRMRIQELKATKLTPAELAAMAPPNPTGTGAVLPKSTSEVKDVGASLTAFASKFEDGEIVISAGDRRRFEMSGIKDRIHIPRKLWREGVTYRVDDCFYDDDGEFLYRVPGMTGGRG